MYRARMLHHRDILGVARSDFRLFREWSDAWFVGLALSVSEEEHLEAAEKIVELQHYLMARIRERARTG